MKIRGISLIIAIILAMLGAMAVFTWQSKKSIVVNSNTFSNIENLNAAAARVRNEPTDGTRPSAKESFAAPMQRAMERITKKPFGIKVSPQNSPIQPERFSGYHTGVDFEIFTNESDAQMNVQAICDGRVTSKRWISGYGGVLIQQCTWLHEPVTVLYGHLSLESISSNTNDTLMAGEIIGYLGKGHSTETDGERKHLHLAVHLGKSIDLRGYIPNAQDLDQWIDVTSLFAN